MKITDKELSRRLRWNAPVDLADCKLAADRIDELVLALMDARQGFYLAYNAVSKGFTDEALLTCGGQGARAAKALKVE